MPGDPDPGHMLEYWAGSFPVPRWVAEKTYRQCYHCQDTFKSNQQHNCRLCGELFCSRCTGKYYLPEHYDLKGKKGLMRVCFGCVITCNRMRQASQSLPLDRVNKTIDVPTWENPDDFVACNKCARREKNHHNCRLCGLLHCEACAAKLNIDIPLAFNKKQKASPHRVCDQCRYRVIAGARLRGPFDPPSPAAYAAHTPTSVASTGSNSGNPVVASMRVPTTPHTPSNGSGTFRSSGAGRAFAFSQNERRTSHSQVSTGRVAVCRENGFDENNMSPEEAARAAQPLQLSALAQLQRNATHGGFTIHGANRNTEDVDLDLADELASLNLGPSAMSATETAPAIPPLPPGEEGRPTGTQQQAEQQHATSSTVCIHVKRVGRSTPLAILELDPETTLDTLNDIMLARCPELRLKSIQYIVRGEPVSRILWDAMKVKSFRGEVHVNETGLMLMPRMIGAGSKTTTAPTATNTTAAAEGSENTAATTAMGDTQTAGLARDPFGDETENEDNEGENAPTNRRTATTATPALASAKRTPATPYAVKNLTVAVPTENTADAMPVSLSVAQRAAAFARGQPVPTTGEQANQK